MVTHHIPDGLLCAPMKVCMHFAQNDLAFSGGNTISKHLLFGMPLVCGVKDVCLHTGKENF